MFSRILSNTPKLYYSLISILIIGLIVLPILAVRNLHSSVCDLGIFTQMYWALTQGQWQRLFFGHATPILAIYAPFFALFPTSITLVTVQALSLLLGLWTYTKIGQHLNLPKYLCLLTFLLFFPVWYNALFDFHSDHLTIPLGMLFFYSCFKRKWLLATVSACLISLVKEPYALMTVFCGIYLILHYKKSGWGLFLICSGTFYFYLTTTILIPAFTYHEGTYIGGFTAYGKDPISILFNIASNPFDVFLDIFSTPNKIIYVFILVGALAFIPLLSPLTTIPALPILGISLLAKNENFYGLGHQYTAAIIPPLLVAFACSYPKAKNIYKLCIKKFTNKSSYNDGFLIFLLFWMLVGNILISPSPISRLFWTNKVWRYGYEAYLQSNRNNIINDALSRYIPEDPDIIVSTQNTLFTDHLARRKALFSFPEGVRKYCMYPNFSGKSKKSKFIADYVVLDLKRPWYLTDRGCGWQTKAVQDLSDHEKIQLKLPNNFPHLKWTGCMSKKFKSDFISAIASVKKRYSTIYNVDGFTIWKRKR